LSKTQKLILAGAGEIEPDSVKAYSDIGGFKALKKALEMTSEEIVNEVKKAKLLGRGGAAFPVGKKWEHLLHIPGTPKYIICNADEGEPGTFKDRHIVANVPLRLIEGMVIAGFTFGSKSGYIYLRAEYRRFLPMLETVLENARKAGFLGKNILGTGFDFDISISMGAGAYICGENSALLNSIEGKVGRPRIKPPHLAEVGLFGKPTLVNNVESFAAIPSIIEFGGDWFLNIGHPDSGGTKLVCLAGHVRNRGVHEIPLGKLTLRQIIYDEELGGGIRDGGTLKFVHPGGQGCGLGGPDQLDTLYCFTEMKKAGLNIGTGAIIVMDDSVPLIDYLASIGEFFADESCGQCVPCTEGCPLVVEYLKKLLVPGQLGKRDLDTLSKIAETMSCASFCGLGETATVPMTSAWKLFKEEFEANVKLEEQQ